MQEVKGLLSKSGSVTLDDNGDGTIDFDVSNAWERWEVDAVVVSTNQASDATPYPTAEVFAGFIADAFSQGASWTGNQDTFTGIADIDDGTDLHVVFTGGIPGSIATARVHGKKYTRRS